MAGMSVWSGTHSVALGRLHDFLKPQTPHLSVGKVVPISGAILGKVWQYLISENTDLPPDSTIPLQVEK